jgi:hypothetical protein
MRLISNDKWDGQVFRKSETVSHQDATHPLIAEAPPRQSRNELTIGGDPGDVWSHCCTLNRDGEVVDRGRFKTNPKAITKWFTDIPLSRVAMEADVHPIWISEQLQELGHEVIDANVRDSRAISHSDRKSDQVDVDKLARYARLDPEMLRPIEHRTVEQQEALTLLRARELLVRLRTAAVNAVRGLTKSCKHMSAHYSFGMVATSVPAQVRYWGQNPTANAPYRQTSRGNKVVPAALTNRQQLSGLFAAHQQFVFRSHSDRLWGLSALRLERQLSVLLLRRLQSASAEINDSLCRHRPIPRTTIVVLVRN